MTDNLQGDIEKISAEIDGIDAQIRKLRDSKVPLAAKRAELLADLEISVKLGGLTKEQRQRIVLKPGAAHGTLTASK